MSKVTISKEALATIPFLDLSALGDRQVPPLSFFDDGKWLLWLPTDKGSLLQLHAIDAAETTYFAREPARDTDLHLKFIDLVFQHLLWPDVARAEEAFSRDIQNLSASVAKLQFIFDHGRDRHLGQGLFVATELEYIVTVCRSLFDFLQEIATYTWQRVGTPHGTKRRKLPRSFSKVVFCEDRPRDSAEIQTQFGLPAPLADFYSRQASFFRLLRGYRDSVIHLGKSPDWIYSTERGFAIPANTKPFNSLGVWDPKHFLPNQLASLKPVIGAFIRRSLDAANDFAEALTATVHLPPSVLPGMRPFIRGFHMHEIVSITRGLHENPWWNLETSNPKEASSPP